MPAAKAAVSTKAKPSMKPAADVKPHVRKATAAANAANAPGLTAKRVVVTLAGAKAKPAGECRRVCGSDGRARKMCREVAGEGSFRFAAVPTKAC